VTAKLGRTIPALPVRDLDAAVAFYTGRLGFEQRHRGDGLAVLGRDDAVLHLWAASDDDWRGRDAGASPVCSGAESFLAVPASCRIEVEDEDALYEELRAAGVLHPVSSDGVETTGFGTREFAALDADGNLLAFYRWVT
jgi:catechol 2,3-dioxygenase-like lactoylglutathione lyase family enzyme